MRAREPRRSSAPERPSLRCFQTSATRRTRGRASAAPDHPAKQGITFRFAFKIWIPWESEASELRATSRCPPPCPTPVDSRRLPVTSGESDPTHFLVLSRGVGTQGRVPLEGFANAARRVRIPPSPQRSTTYRQSESLLEDADARPPGLTFSTPCPWSR